MAFCGNTVEAVDIPVVVNGDIIDGETAKAALEASNAAGVMVGRAVIGRPWLPGQIETFLDTGVWPEAPCAAQQWRIFADWYGDCLALYGEGLGCVWRANISPDLLKACSALRAAKRIVAKFVA